MLILLVHETNTANLTLTWLGCKDTFKKRRKTEGDKGDPLTNNKSILRTKANAISSAALEHRFEMPIF